MKENALGDGKRISGIKETTPDRNNLSGVVFAFMDQTLIWSACPAINPKIH